MKFNDLSALMFAAETLFACNNMNDVRNKLGATSVPTEWEERCRQANGQVLKLRQCRLKDYIPEDQIDLENAAPDDDALEVMCDGEDSTMQLLVMYSHTEALHEVLASLFEGELYAAAMG